MDFLRVCFWILAAISTVWYFKDRDSWVFRASSAAATILITFLGGY
tara:strand:- start:67165 stop:67302 length:138 start_codon:yes stop_codon:yes gene_type:complete